MPIRLNDIAALGLGSIVWDSGKGAVAGFGARRQKGAAVAYVLKYRTAGGKQRWHTIGKHGAPWTPDLARAEAKRLLGVRHRFHSVTEVAKEPLYRDPTGVRIINLLGGSMSINYAEKPNRK